MEESSSTTRGVVTVLAASGSARVAAAFCLYLGCFFFLSRPVPDIAAHETAPVAHGPKPTPAPTRRRRVAVGFHGAYDRKGSEFDRLACSDFFEVADNIESRLLAPLRSTYDVDTFFHTFHHDKCRAKDDALNTVLAPKAYNFSKHKLPRIIDSYLAVIDLILEEAYGPGAAHRSNEIAAAAAVSSIDYVVLARFDVRYSLPFNKLRIDMEKLNFAFRDKEVYWNKRRKISDLFFVMPMRYLATFRKVLDGSCCARFEALPLSMLEGTAKKQGGKASEKKEKKEKRRGKVDSKGGKARRLSKGEQGKLADADFRKVRKAKNTNARVQLVAQRLEEARNHKLAELQRNGTANGTSVPTSEWDCPGVREGPSCPGHFVYPGLVDAIGERNLRFIDDKFRTSNININRGEHRGRRHDPNEDAFLAIDRSCAGKQKDSNAEKLHRLGNSPTGCWRGIAEAARTRKPTTSPAEAAGSGPSSAGAEGHKGMHKGTAKRKGKWFSWL